MSNLKLDVKIFDELQKIKNRLPEMDPGQEWDYPAGLALLGSKDNLIDEVIHLKLTSGCYDVPGISYGSMDKGLRKMLKLDRIVSGIALIKNQGYDSESGTRFSGDMKAKIREMKNSFEDITKTIWISFGANFFRTYRVHKDKEGRLFIDDVVYGKEFFHIGEAENKTYIRIEGEKLKKVEEKAAEARARKAARKRIEKAKIEEEKARREKEKALKKLKETKLKEIKSKKKEIIDLGDGYHFRLTRDGKYILWR